MKYLEEGEGVPVRGGGASGVGGVEVVTSVYDSHQLEIARGGYQNSYVCRYVYQRIYLLQTQHSLLVTQQYNNIVVSLMSILQSNACKLSLKINLM